VDCYLSPSWELSGLHRVSFIEMRTLFRKAAPLLCALMAAVTAGQIAELGAARSNHLKGSSSPYLRSAPGGLHLNASPL
jgi:hypothetical protein